MANGTSYVGGKLQKESMGLMKLAIAFKLDL